MKPCQLCGAKSWGEVPASIDIHRTAEMFLIGKDLSQYRRCDNCGSYVSLVQMALEDPPRRDPVEDSLKETFGQMGTYVAPFTSAALSLMPKPETRLERLVRAMLGNPGQHTFLRPAPDLVHFARMVEGELDATQVAALGTPLSPINQQFAALQAFVSRIESMTLEGGALERGTGSTAALVCQALATLKEAL